MKDPRLKKLEEIRSGAVSRGLSLAKIYVSGSARAAKFAASALFQNDEERESSKHRLLIDQITDLTRELGALKGSLMKVGQTLSMFGEMVLPPEVNNILKSLQSDSPALPFEQVQRLLKQELGESKLSELEINPEPIGAASLGQVHRARVLKTDQEIVLKIQYPGVDRAIDTDLKALKTIFSIAKILPQQMQFEAVVSEVRAMLVQELDYRQEFGFLTEIGARIRAWDRENAFIIPLGIAEYSSSRVLAMTFEDGIKMDSDVVKSLPLARRNYLAQKSLELYFFELYGLQKMQTDPHFGNYGVRLGKNGERDQIILFDFGAVKVIPPDFYKSYYQMARGGFFANRQEIIEAAYGLKFLYESDPSDVKEQFVDLVLLITEPFLEKPGTGKIQALYNSEGHYIWNKSDLPKRAAAQAAKLALAWKLRPPPSDLVFLDRKMGGIFIHMSTLGAEFDTRSVIAPYLENKQKS